MKRQRGRGRKSGAPSHRSSYESNGPNVKVRGAPSHIYDKYIQLARDSSSSGDRVMAENYYQHAEHYLRILQVGQLKREELEMETEERDVIEGRMSPGSSASGEDPPRPRRSRDRRRKEGAAGGEDPLQMVEPQAGDFARMGKFRRGNQSEDSSH